MKFVFEDLNKKEVFWPLETLKKKAWVNDEKIYTEAQKDPFKFWSEVAKELVWFKDWEKVYVEELPYFKWFVGGKINACYNALDRHLKEKGKKKAIIWEPENLEKCRILTYEELYEKVSKFASVLKSLGVKKGDRVTIYLPLIPEAQISMLACARIGAIHSVVFSAFSPQSLKIRIEDAESKILITADGYYRRGKLIELKKQADEGIKDTSIEKVIVVRRAGNDVEMKEGRDFWFDDLIKNSEFCEPEIMDSEDILFILHTSGTTGKPKAIVHSTGGYLTQAYITTKWNFNLHDDDIMWCTSDIGWITGHTYCCYGPLLNASTILIYEGVPDYPSPERFWEIIEKHNVTVFYTAPTVIRMLIRLGDEFVEKHELESLRILGSVGEPIDRETWLWYFKKVGKERCPIIDTWWQTETGGTLINSLPGIGPFIPAYAGKSFPGTRHAVFDEDGKEVKPNEQGYLVQLSPFAPGMLRGLWRDPERYKETYWSKFGGKVYFTGDGAKIDEDGNFRITGRVDDVMKVAGHRLANAELEEALNEHTAVVESAVIGIPHSIKGEIPVAFVILDKKFQATETLEKELIKQIEKKIGPIARPEKIYFVEDLPKTRSGKIIRRLLKQVILGQEFGDISTLSNPECIELIKKVIKR